MYPINDVEFEERKVDSAEKSGDGWVINHDGWSFYVPPESQIVPEAGMVARFYGRGIGSTVRGLFLDGVKVFYKTPAEQKAIDDEWRRNYELECQKRKLEPKNPEPQIEGFEWTDDMNEISGFGSDYERTCRTMVSQGCKWWSENPEKDPSVKTLKNVYGIAQPNNEDAKSLEDAMMEGIDDCTGAMHQASLSHIFAWKRFGSWQAYQTEMRKKHDEAEEKT